MNIFKEFSFLIFFSIITSCSKEEQQLTIFSGDSLIKNWDVEKYFPYLRTENRGVDGCTIEQCFKQTGEGNNNSVVLLIGTNNLSQKTNNFNILIEEYLRLVNNFNAKYTYCISILPRNNFTNEVIEHFNKRLANELKSKENVIFIDVYNDFYWNGQINPEYTIDGLHLSDKGYELLTYKLSKWL